METPGLTEKPLYKMHEVCSLFKVTKPTIYVFRQKGMTLLESAGKFECHRRHIDIQLCIKGEETIGWSPSENCSRPDGEFNIEKDFLFYKDKPEMYFRLNENQFVIFLPTDVHAPLIGEGIIKKLVIKVLI